MKCPRLDGFRDLTASDGRVTPCCVFDTSNGWKSSIYTGIDEPEWKSARDRLEEGWTQECYICETNEKNGHESMRQSSIKDGIQISLDFTCNFMCRSCKPALSSKWDSHSHDEDWTRFDSEHFYHEPKKKIHSESVDRFLNFIDLSRLKEIRIVGGEPFYSKKLLTFLQRLPKTSKICFNTNGSIFPEDKVLRELDKFDEVQMDLSIDAVGELAECIRYGTDWNEVERNIARHIEYWNRVFIFSTVSVMNVNKMNEVYDFAGGDEYHGGRSRMNPLYDPSFLKLEQIPIVHRKKWGIKELTGNGDFNNIIWSNQQVKNEHEKTRDFLMTCDKYQGWKFSKVNPEIWELLQ